MKEDQRFTKAWDKVSGRVVHINDLPRSRNGLKCDCVCVTCKEPLEACQGYVRKWYFRHQSKTNCNGGPMTALHILAQHLLMGNQTIQTERGQVVYVNGITEYQLPNSQFRADICGSSEEQLFALEILVNHRVETLKQEYYKSNRIHAIEIDLSDIDPDISSDDLLDILLNDTSIQNELYSPLGIQKSEPETAKDSKSWLPDWVWLAAIVALAYGVIKLFSSPSRRRGSNGHNRKG